MAVPIAPLRTRGRGAPLSWLIVRYFAYTVLGIGAAWVASFAAFSAACNAGMVYPASWGPAHMDEVAAALRDEGAFDAGALPTAYRYALVSDDGTVLDTDLTGEQLERARELARAESAESDGTASELEQIGGGGGVTYGTVALADGTVCVLRCEYLPQFISRELAESLPNPQNLMLAAGCAGSVAATALVARRASRMISRSLAPLSAAAEKVGAQQLDFSVGITGVREVNEVLAAMDRMRASLAESLEARYRAERRQRDQVAALAHDLKTPLTVIYGYAQAFRDGRVPPEKEQDYHRIIGEKALAASELIDTLFAYAKMEHPEYAPNLEPWRVDELVRSVAHEAEAQVEQAGCSLFVVPEGASLAQAARGDESPGTAASNAEPIARIDRQLFHRLLMNLISNACAHNPSGTSIYLACEVDAGRGLVRVRVADTGTGIPDHIASHAFDPFVTENAARSTNGGTGLGLTIARRAAELMGGTLTLSPNPPHPCATEFVIELPRCTKE